MTDKMLVSYYLEHDSSWVRMFLRPDGSMYRKTTRLGIVTIEEVRDFVTFPEDK